MARRRKSCRDFFTIIITTSFLRAWTPIRALSLFIMPNLISCSRCGKVHPYGQCSIPPAPRRRYPRTDPAGKFRCTAAWQRKRNEIRERDLHLCKLCLSNGRITNTSLEVHHIIPVTADDRLRLDDDNLITLCSSCHALVEGDKEFVPRLQGLAKKSPRQILAEIRE